MQSSSTRHTTTNGRIPLHDPRLRVIFAYVLGIHAYMHTYERVLLYLLTYSLKLLGRQLTPGIYFLTGRNETRSFDGRQA